MTQTTLVRAALRLALIPSVVACASAHATIVQFQTNLGDFEVNLYDEGTPETVANFLAYLEAGTYNGSIIHRVQNNFVVQGGGFALDDEDVPRASANLWSPKNEPVFSNVAGTIAMAKQANRPDSATNQWFINLSDNSANSADLDRQNGGFTVFGEVVGEGMDVVKAIAATRTFNLAKNSPLSEDSRSSTIASAFNTTPLIDVPADSSVNTVEAMVNHWVIVENIIVVDAAEDTAAGLSPPRNTLILAPPSEPQPEPAPSAPPRKKKGGAVDWLVWLLTAGVAGVASMRRKRT